MSKRQLRLVSILGQSITYADPSAVGNTTRFDQSVSNAKTTIGLIPLQRAEMISLNNVCAKTGCEATATTLMQSSVRIKVASPLANASEMKQQVLDALDNFKVAVENGLLDGVKPDAMTALFVNDVV